MYKYCYYNNVCKNEDTYLRKKSALYWPVRGESYGVLELLIHMQVTGVALKSIVFELFAKIYFGSNIYHVPHPPPLEGRERGWVKNRNRFLVFPWRLIHIPKMVGNGDVPSSYLFINKIYITYDYKT